MKKGTIKYIIDMTMFIDITAIAAVGLLLGFVIPRGQVPYSEKYFLGLHRHDWGDIHLYLSVFLLSLLVVHLCLNWTWIVQCSKTHFGDRWKKALLASSGAWFIVLFIAWLAVKL